MGFMDKARKLAEQTQQQAKDGTLKERAKALAEQAQQKLDEVQGQFNDRQRAGGAPPPEAPTAPTPEAPPAPASETPGGPTSEPTAPPAGPAGPAADADRTHEAAPKVTGGDPLAG
jgi:hypothetical protein